MVAKLFVHSLLNFVMHEFGSQFLRKSWVEFVGSACGPFDSSFNGNGEVHGFGVLGYSNGGALGLDYDFKTGVDGVIASPIYVKSPDERKHSGVSEKVIASR